MKAREIAFHQKSRDSPLALSKEQVDIGDLAIGNPLFMSIEKIAISTQFRLRLNSARIAASIRLAESKSSDDFARSQPGEPEILLVSIAPALDSVRDHAMYRKQTAQRGATSAKFLI